MKFCENCGAPLEDDALFCESCGEKVEAGEGSPVEVAAPETEAEEQAENEEIKPEAEPEVIKEEIKPEVVKEKSGSIKKWIFGGVAAVAVIGLTVSLTVFFTQGNSGNEEAGKGQNQTANAVESATPEPTEAVTPTPEVTAVPTEAPDMSYVLAESNTKYLKNADVKGMSKANLRLARNEIYARHGYIFSDGELTAFFEKKAWYNPTVKKSKWKDDVLNKYEKANVTFLYNKENGISTGNQPPAKPKVNEFEEDAGESVEGTSYTVTWNKVPGASGYQYYAVQKMDYGDGEEDDEPYCETQNTTSRSYTVAASDPLIVSFKVRAYKKINGKTKYGPWSKMVYCYMNSY